MNQNTTGRSLTYLLLGVAAGTVLGLLVAPRKGEETRETIGEWLKQQREKGTEKVSEWREKIPEQKNKVRAAIKAGRDAFNHKVLKKEPEAVEA